MPRTDIISATGQPPITQPPPAVHDVSICNVLRVETKDHGPGNPNLTPKALTGAMDLVAEKPWQCFPLKNERGETELTVADYTIGVVRGGDLFDNTRPERLAEILSPKTPKRPHEPGLISRVAHQIAAYDALRHTGANGPCLGADTAAWCAAEEARLVALIDRLDELQEMIEDTSSPSASNA